MFKINSNMISFAYIIKTFRVKTRKKKLIESFIYISEKTKKKKKL